MFSLRIYSLIVFVPHCASVSNAVSLSELSFRQKADTLRIINHIIIFRLESPRRRSYVPLMLGERMIQEELIQSVNSYDRPRKSATCAPNLRALCLSSLLTCVIGTPISLAKSSMSFLSVSESLSTSR